MLVVLGGDGTIRTAAQACSETGTYLLPLPGGTMNMLPRALYGDASWQDTLKGTSLLLQRRCFRRSRHKQPVLRCHCCRCSWAVDGRPEAIREGDILDAVEKSGIALEAMFDTTVEYLISPEVTGEAEVVAVICPLVSEEMADSKQALEAAAIYVENAVELLALATAAAFGKWREDKSVTLSKPGGWLCNQAETFRYSSMTKE